MLHRFTERQVCELRFRARRSGREVVLPVMYAQHDGTVVILVGRSDRKRWWRTFTRPRRVEVSLNGTACEGTGRVVRPGTPTRAVAARIYGSRFPHVRVGDDPMVVIDLDPAP
ncbi:MAG: hypothetical protein HOV79_10165 [Hamadaea sp.]|nr:hypothetical protein [Hamadaea sp.]